MQINNAIIPSSNQGMSVAAEGFFRQKRIFLFVAIGIFVVTLAVAFLTPKQYGSEMKFLVQNSRENVLLTAERTTPATTVSDVTETQVNSELEILHSRDVLDSVVDPSWSETSVNQLAPAQVQRHEKSLKSFEKSLSAEPVRRTNIIQVSVTADTPELAKQELERLSAAYLAEHRKLQRPAGTSQFFTAEAEKSRKAWDEAAQKLADFQRDNQFLTLTDRKVVLNAEINRHETDLLRLDAVLREMDEQVAESSRQLSTMPMRQTTQEKAIPNQDSAQKLNSLLIELQNKRTALLTNYKTDDRFVQELDRQIATTKSALQDAQAATSHEQTTDVDPAWQEIRTNYVQTKISKKATEQHRAGLAGQMEGLKKQLADSEGLTVQYNNLEARTNELKENYQLYAQKRDQAQVEDAMDEHKLLNIAVAQQPTLSYMAVKPRRLLILALGMLTALFAGFCAVYFAETARNTVATPRELEALSRYPVLATVPYNPLVTGKILEAAYNSNLNLLPADQQQASRSLRHSFSD
jgi:uncharacterized protein involved in exopolysaccharide biosynthesis